MHRHRQSPTKWRQQPPSLRRRHQQRLHLRLSQNRLEPPRNRRHPPPAELHQPAKLARPNPLHLAPLQNGTNPRNHPHRQHRPQPTRPKPRNQPLHPSTNKTDLPNHQPHQSRQQQPANMQITHLRAQRPKSIRQVEINRRKGMLAGNDNHPLLTPHVIIDVKENIP